MRFQAIVYGVIALLAALTASAPQPVLAAGHREGISAAFVRSGDLWLTTGSEERKAAAGPAIATPLWSEDGRWVAYSKGDSFVKELWLLQVESGKQLLVNRAVSGRYEWAPDAERLAYQTDGRLRVIEAEHPDKVLGTADEIGSFSWLPGGDGFIAAQETELQEGGFTPVRIFRMTLAQMGQPNLYKTLHVLPGQSDDFFAVRTSLFKWSADGHWIAFLAEPTASLSADSNTLCVLREDGVVLRTLDHMARNDNWFEWAPAGAELAYIAGEGRDAGTNKRLKITRIDSGRTALYTPRGYTDNDFAWQGVGQLVVSRGRETADTGSEGVPRRKLIAVALQSGRQKTLTRPRGHTGDYAPQAFPNRLAWIRRDAEHADVLLGTPDGDESVVWIADLEQGESYYGQWDSRRVLDLIVRK